MPGRRHQHVLHRPVDDGVVIHDQLAALGHDAADLLQPLAVDGGDAVASDPKRRAVRGFSIVSMYMRSCASGTKPAVPVAPMYCTIARRLTHGPDFEPARDVSDEQLVTELARAIADYLSPDRSR